MSETISELLTDYPELLTLHRSRAYVARRLARAEERAPHPDERAG